MTSTLTMFETLLTSAQTSVVSTRSQVTETSGRMERRNVVAVLGQLATGEEYMQCKPIPFRPDNLHLQV